MSVMHCGVLLELRGLEVVVVSWAAEDKKILEEMGFFYKFLSPL